MNQPIASRFLPAGGGTDRDAVFRVTSIDSGDITIHMPDVGTIFLPPLMAAKLGRCLLDKAGGVAMEIMDLEGPGT